MSEVHICAPPPTAVFIFLCQCPTCERDTWKLVHKYEWYGPHATCLWCGEEWNDGEMQKRPFARAWRQNNIKAALRRAKQHGIEIPEGATP